MSSITMVYAGYNEELNVKKAVAETVDAFESAKIEYEIILIDDGSEDGTWEVMQECSQKHANVRSMRNTVNLNFGTSVLIGMMQASKEYVVYNAFDLPLMPAKISELVWGGYLDDADVIVFERVNYLCTNKRKIVSYLNKILQRMLFPKLMKGTPVLNFSQIYKVEIAKEIIPLSRGPIFVWPELVFRAKLKGYRVKNLKMPCNPNMKVRKGSFGHPHDIIWGIYEMLRFRMKLWQKKI